MADSQANKVTVNIFGEEYPITGVSDPAYISRIADFVDLRMRETAKGSRTAARDKIAILTAMSLASELYENKEDSEHSQEKYDSQLDQLINRLDSALKP